MGGVNGQSPRPFRLFTRIAQQNLLLLERKCFMSEMSDDERALRIAALVVNIAKVGLLLLILL